MNHLMESKQNRRVTIIGAVYVILSAVFILAFPNVNGLKIFLVLGNVLLILFNLTNLISLLDDPVKRKRTWRYLIILYVVCGALLISTKYIMNNQIIETMADISQSITKREEVVNSFSRVYYLLSISLAWFRSQVFVLLNEGSVFKN